jgi:phosphoserine phosphatase
MRHGHVDYMSREVRESRDPRIARLTPLGEEQAQAAGEALADLSFDVAVCSGLRRTRETAEIVLAAHPAPPPLEDEFGLEELHSGGYIAFQSREQLSAAMTFAFEQAPVPGATFFDGGERFADGQARAVGAIERLLARPGWAQALVVAHEGINRLILSWMARAGLSGAVAFEQDLACINVLDFDLTPDGDQTRIERMMIKAVNLTPYAWTKAGLHLSSFEAIFATPVIEDA